MENVSEGGSDLGQTSYTSEQAPVVHSQEKMIPQSRVEEIVRDRINQKESRLRQEHEAERARWNTQSAPQQNVGMGGTPHISPDHIQRMVEEATKQHQESLTREWLSHQSQQETKRVVDSFIGKVQNANEKYADFNDKVSQLQLDKLPDIVKLAANVENTADVVYDLANNPGKMGNILSLANNPDTYHLAEIAMRRLSDSIQQNESSKNVRHAPDPLNPIKPSLSGTDNGSSGVRGLRGQSWLKA